MTEAGDRRPIAARGAPPVVWLAAWLVRRRASPDAISLAGMGAAMLAGAVLVSVAMEPWAWLGVAAMVQVRLLANLLDGMVALGRGVASPAGELFNEIPDRVSDTAVLAGLGWAIGQPELGLAAALAAMATAYVRAVGRGLGQASTFAGPMAKQHRMAVVTAACVLMALWPDPRWVVGALWIVLAGSALTAGRRLVHVYRVAAG